LTEGSHHPSPGGFSRVGRFSSATQRISRLLADAAYIDKLVRERQSQVFKALIDLRALIDRVIAAKESQAP
jgi:hypothetical protein